MLDAYATHQKGGTFLRPKKHARARKLRCVILRCVPFRSSMNNRLVYACRNATIILTFLRNSDKACI